MRRFARFLGRLLVVGGAVAAAAAAGRAAMSRLAGEPGEASRSASFDAWPAVTPAPGRPTANGSGVRASR